VSAPAAAEPASIPQNKLTIARGLSRVGLILGLAVLSMLVVDGVIRESAGWRSALGWGAAYTGIGAVLIWLGGNLASWLLLGSRMRAELDRGNTAVGFIASGHYVAVSWILVNCFSGRDLASLRVSVVFFVIGVATLLGMQVLYRTLTRYDDAQEVLAGNMAAATSFVGLTLGLALVVAHAAEGTFAGWGPSLRAYAGALLLAVALYPVRQFVVGPLVGCPPSMRSRALDRLVVQERNFEVGLIEGLAYIAVAALATAIG